MYKRSLKPKLEAAIKRSPSVLITGPRQAGKTTLIQELGKNHVYSYTNFDDIISLSSATNDPVGFIANLQKPAIIDEIQRAQPDLFLTIKKDIDENRKAGRYAMTGSTNPLLVPQLANAFVGRMEILHLMPLSVGELLGKNSHFIDTMFKKDVTAADFSKNKITKQELYEFILAGGYPLVQNVSEADRIAWFHSYVTTILERDVQELAHIEKLTRLPNLLKLLAARTGNLLNIANLAETNNDIPRTTMHRYLALFQKLFLVYICQPWGGNLGNRLIKTPKTFFYDTGLLAFLLNINMERAYADPILMGSILENFVITELIKQETWNAARIQLYHFRTSSDIEVDVVLEDASGNIVGIEVKHSGTVTSSDFKGLAFLQEKAKDKFVRGIVLYMGTECVPFGNNLWALPINQLWEL
jgi:predicted AAA+ superfamily ATPase